MYNLTINSSNYTYITKNYKKLYNEVQIKMNQKKSFDYILTYKLRTK